MTKLRSSILAVALLVPAQALHAQVVSLPGARRTATTWVSGAGALFDMQSFAGGRDGGVWNWEGGVQLRGTVERAMRSDMSVGISGSYARLPLTVSGGACHGCRGDATIWQSMAVLRLGGGGGVGFHTALEAGAGVAGFANVTRGTDASSVPGPPTTPNQSIVPAVAASYGVGYTLNPGLELSLVQEIGILIVSTADDAPAGSSSTPRFNATRLTLRYALGR